MNLVRKAITMMTRKNGKKPEIMKTQKENVLIEELRTIAGIVSGSQAEFYNQMLKDAKPIKVAKLAEVYSTQEIAQIKALVDPQPKLCYKNATLFALYFPGVEYVEGKMTCFGKFGIEHAWNKVGDKYIDITMELALERDPSEEEYLALGEYDAATVSKICLDREYYGEVYQEMLRKKFFNKVF